MSGLKSIAGVASFVLAFAGVLALAGSAQAAGTEIVADGGFEDNSCDSGSCTNWDDSFSDPGQTFICTVELCALRPAGGTHWAVVGAGEAPVGAASVRGGFSQTLDLLEGPATVSFDLKRGLAVPGVTSYFSLNIQSGSGGTCCLYSTGPSDSKSGYQHIEIPIVTQEYYNRFGFSASCTKNSGGSTPCPRYDIDNVSIKVESPVVLTKHPDAVTRKRSATFAFKSDEQDATFECSLDGKAFKPCLSPRLYHVDPGRHIFRVQQVGRPSPARIFKWKVTQ